MPPSCRNAFKGSQTRNRLGEHSQLDVSSMKTGTLCQKTQDHLVTLLKHENSHVVPPAKLSCSRGAQYRPMLVEETTTKNSGIPRIVVLTIMSDHTQGPLHQYIVHFVNASPHVVCQMQDPLPLHMQDPNCILIKKTCLFWSTILPSLFVQHGLMSQFPGLWAEAEEYKNRGASPSTTHGHNATQMQP